MKILIIKTHAIGDVLMTTPAIRAIKKKYPESHMSMLVGEWSKEVVEGNPYLDRIITFRDADLLKFDLSNIVQNHRVYSLIKELRADHFDAIFMFHRAPSIHFLGWLIGAPERIGISESKIAPFLTHKALCSKNSDRYAVMDYMEVAHAVGRDDDVSLDMKITERERAFAESQLSTLNSQLIGVCPGGTINPAESVMARRWSIERYARLCDELRKQGLQIVIFGSKDDLPVANKLMSIIGQTHGFADTCINMCGKATLKQLVALIERCQVIVTNDSAPLHIAVTVGTPSVSLFGPTIGKARIPPDSKHIAIQSNLECSPCYNNRRFPGCKNPRCMEYISVKQVKNAVLRLL